MKAQNALWTCVCVASLLGATSAACSVAHASEAEGFALGLQGDAGSACLSAEQLASSLAARRGSAVPTAAGDTALSVSVSVRTIEPRRFAVLIETHDPASGARGRRELTIDDACDALAGHLSLVIALMIGPGPVPAPQAAAPELPSVAPAPVVAPAPAPAAVPVPAPPNVPNVRPPASPVPARRAGDLAQPRRQPHRFEVGLGGGADIGLLPRSLPVLQVAGRMRWVPAATADRGIPLLSELAIELWPSIPIERAGTEVRVTGATVGSTLCSAWSYGDASFEPCAGLWLRPLRASAPSTVVDPEWFLLSGWSAKLNVRFAVARTCWLFVAAQAISPFGPRRLVLESPAVPERREPPFFNATPGTAGTRIVVHELPVIGAVLLGGVMIAVDP